MSNTKFLDSEGTKRLRKRLVSQNLAETSRDNNALLSALQSKKMR